MEEGGCVGTSAGRGMAAGGIQLLKTVSLSALVKDQLKGLGHTKVMREWGFQKKETSL